MLGCALFFVILVFCLYRRQISDAGVRALFIVERDIVPERSGQITHVGISVTMSFLYLQTGEEGLHGCVVIGNTWSGKRLLCSTTKKQSSEFVGCILGTSVTMKK